MRNIKITDFKLQLNVILEENIGPLLHYIYLKTIVTTCFASLHEVIANCFTAKVVHLEIYVLLTVRVKKMLKINPNVDSCC